MDSESREVAHVARRVTVVMDELEAELTKLQSQLHRLRAGLLAMLVELPDDPERRAA